MNQIEKSERYKEKTFEDIKHIDKYGNEYWEARELQMALNYSKWENFEKVIDKAKNACNNSHNNISEHFPEVRKPIIGGNGNVQYIVNYHLSRYACYLIVQNADLRKEVIALGQTYFAIQTRKQELTEQEYDLLNENEKRFYQRKLTKQGNYTLQQTATKAGVKNMHQFHNSEYKGLYNGETADDIFKIKKLLNDNIQGEENAKDAHFEVGQKVRKAITDIGGKMPEELPTSKKSLKELERGKKQLEIANSDKETQI